MGKLVGNVLFLSIGILIFFFSSSAYAFIIDPGAAGGVRDNGYNIFTINSVGAKDLSPSSLHDKGIVEFDIGSFTIDPPTTLLEFVSVDLDFGYAGTPALEIYYFWGDGLVTSDDWDSEYHRLFTTFTDQTNSETFVSLDVTLLVQIGRELGKTWLGFKFDAPNLYTEGGHRYWIDKPGSLATGEGAVLASGETPVPGPGTLLLLGSGLVSLAGLRRRRDRKLLFGKHIS